MLADDHLDLGERPLGGAHPHAGFETVTLLIEGEIFDREPQGDPIVSHGPFIADTRDDIARLFQEYRSNRFARLSELAHARSSSG